MNKETVGIRTVAMRDAPAKVEVSMVIEAEGQVVDEKALAQRVAAAHRAATEALEAPAEKNA